jgi:hypothetical protein
VTSRPYRIRSVTSRPYRIRSVTSRPYRIRSVTSRPYRIRSVTSRPYTSRPYRIRSVTSRPYRIRSVTSTLAVHRARLGVTVRPSRAHWYVEGARRLGFGYSLLSMNAVSKDLDRLGRRLHIRQAAPTAHISRASLHSTSTVLNSIQPTGTGATVSYVLRIAYRYDLAGCRDEFSTGTTVHI